MNNYTKHQTANTKHQSSVRARRRAWCLVFGVWLAALSAGAQLKTNQVFTGTTAGDGTGNTARHAFQLINTNLVSLDRRLAEVNVKEHFGAAGDGIADDTAEIQAAIDAADAVRLPLYFPPGDYLVSDTLLVPVAGALSLTNRPTWRGEDYTVSRIFASSAMTQKDVIRLSSSPGQQGAFHLSGLSVYGPAQAWGLTNYPTIAAADAVLSGACLSLGLHTGAAYAGEGLSAFNVQIDGCYLVGHEFGICATNVQGLVLRDNWIKQNAKGNIVMSHVDSGKVFSGHYGDLLCTNRAELIYNVWVIGTPGSVFAGPASYYGGADSGVNKIFENLEMNDPFMYADGARVQVLGGQFENKGAFLTPLTNGWCFLTNYGQYNFIGSTINMPGTNHLTADTTNTILFHCSGNASSGLRLLGCELDGMDATLDSTRATWFRIMGDPAHNYLYHPWWSVGAIGPNSGQSRPTFLNTLWIPEGGSPSYLHIPPQQMGAVAQIGGRDYGPTLTNATYYGDASGVTNQPMNSAVFLEDEFAGGSTTTPQFGALGWITAFAGGTLENGNPNADHPWNWDLTTGSASNNTAHIKLEKRLGGYAIVMSRKYEAMFVFKLASTVQCDVFVGFSYDYNNAPYELNQYGGRYATAGYSYGLFYTNGAANFWYIGAPGAVGATTFADSGVAVDTSWHTLRIKSPGSGNTDYSLDGGAWVRINQGAGGTAMHPMFCITAGDGGSKTLSFDLFRMQSYPNR